jgi:NodT family efflux transporter outer membrane factor (OMF) lipoprotein
MKVAPHRRCRSRLKLAVGLCLGAASTACSVAPPYRAPPPPAVDQYRELGDWSRANPSDQLPRGDWWHDFGDPTLDELESKIDAANPDLAAAADRYQQSRALAVEAHAALLPTIGAQAFDNADHQSANRPLRNATQPNPYHDDLLAGTLSWELDLWGRVRSAAVAGTAAAQASSADLESVRLALHAELAQDYIALRDQDAQQRLLEQTVDAYSRALTMTTTRFEGGIASGLDVAQAQTQLATARASLTDVIERRALLEHALATLIGSTAAQFTLPPGELTMQMPTVPVALPSTLLERRPDVAAAERRMAAYNATIGIARAAFFPRLSLAAIVGFEDTQGAGLLSAPNRFWAIGPQGVLTVFDHGYRAAVVAEARSRFDEASDRYRGTVLKALREVEDALARNHLLEQELGQQQDARAAAERALQLSTNRYEEGAVSYLQVVTTQVSALASERAALDLTSRQLQADVELIAALGGGWQADWPVTASAVGSRTAGAARAAAPAANFRTPAQTAK